MSQLVSIIIPCYNRENIITQTLESVLNQTYKNWECIIVDDGSTDNTKEQIKKFCKKDERFKLYERPVSRNKGGNSCRNYGFEKSRGKFIQWFDSDDIMHKDKLLLKVEILEKTDCDFVVCEGIEFENKISNTINKWNKIKSENPLLDHVIGKVSFHTNGPLFKKTFLDTKALFDENLLRKQEWEFYTRLLTFSQNYKSINKILYYFRIHSNSINGKNELKTLPSVINANRKVFSIIKNEKKLINELPYLRRHFFNKYLAIFKILKKNVNGSLFLLLLKGVVEVLNFKLIKYLLLNFIKKPKTILKNLRN